MSGIASVETWSGKGRADENFPVGSLLIRRDLRAHVHAFYDFARNADDIADSHTLAPEEKISRLNIMEDVLLGRRHDGSPSALRLRDSLARTGVTTRHSTDLLVAFRQDATKRRYETVEELHEYCRYSAAPVGRHVLDLHGENHITHSPSDALCTSLQILNHLQDCAVDLERLDRCYLPRTMLARFGGSTEDLRRSSASDGLRLVFNELLQLVERMNHSAMDLPRRTRNRRLRLETAVIVGLAVRLQKRLEREDPLAARVKLRKPDIASSMIFAVRFI
ncbi:MAG: squalene synthase HpnC [Acetobacteraceae bacterium]|nr:squalene synthase HpnC [Acetobacteraceae bacterium]